VSFFYAMIIFIPATITPVELRWVAIRSSVMHALNIMQTDQCRIATSLVKL